MIPNKKTVLIEYAPMQNRVIVRGVWDGDAPKLPLLEEGNVQNYVKVFEGVDMNWNVGFDLS